MFALVKIQIPLTYNEEATAVIDWDSEGCQDKFGIAALLNALQEINNFTVINFTGKNDEVIHAMPIDAELKELAESAFEERLEENSEKHFYYYYPSNHAGPALVKFAKELDRQLNEIVEMEGAK